jgi:hypothetical protein
MSVKYVKVPIENKTVTASECWQPKKTPKLGNAIISEGMNYEKDGEKWAKYADGNMKANECRATEPARKEWGHLIGRGYCHHKQSSVHETGIKHHGE